MKNQSRLANGNATTSKLLSHIEQSNSEITCLYGKADERGQGQKGTSGRLEMYTNLSWDGC
jgi:hypothetical protein